MRRKTKRKDVGKGYIEKVVRGSRKLHNYLWDLTENLDFDHNDPELVRRQYHEFIVHIYHSMVRQRMKREKYAKNEGYIPIKGYLIDAEIGREVNYRVLKEAGLISTQQYSHRGKKSRRYKLVNKVWRNARKIEDNYIRKAWKGLTSGNPRRFVVVNLRDGQQLRRVCGHKLEFRNPHFKTPKLVKDSIKTISECSFDPRNAGKLVNSLEKSVRRSEKKFEKLKSKPMYKNNPDKNFASIRKAEEKHFRFERRYVNLRSCQAAILGQNPKLLRMKTSTGGPLYNYKAAYEPQVSGRLTERHGGMQNASRVFKHFCFIDLIKQKQVFNYDLKASQANILSQELEQCGIDNSWIIEYLNDENAKKTYANQIGTDTDTWKECLYSTIMGAEPTNKKGAPSLALLNYFDNHDEAQMAHDKFLKHAKGLIESCDLWREVIYSGNVYTYLTSGLTHWKNAGQMKHKDYGKDRNDNLILMDSVYDNKENPKKYEIQIITQKYDIDKLKRKLAAFILQGRESYFIHHLTLLCDTHRPKIKVLRNEHDGIITNKKIPAKLINKAGKLSGLQHPVLDIKPLASQDDIKKMKRLTEEFK